MIPVNAIHAKASEKGFTRLQAGSPSSFAPPPQLWTSTLVDGRVAFVDKSSQRRRPSRLSRDLDSQRLDLLIILAIIRPS